MIFSLFLLLMCLLLGFVKSFLHLSEIGRRWGKYNSSSTHTKLATAVKPYLNQEQTFRVDVGGFPYIISQSNIQKHPGSFFDTMKNNGIDMVSINRDRYLFKFIYEYLVSGHLPRDQQGILTLDNKTLQDLQVEAEFYGLKALTEECNAAPKPESEFDLKSVFTMKQYIEHIRKETYSPVQLNCPDKYISPLVRALMDRSSALSVIGQHEHNFIPVQQYITPEFYNIACNVLDLYELSEYMRECDNDTTYSTDSYSDDSSYDNSYSDEDSDSEYSDDYSDSDDESYSDDEDSDSDPDSVPNPSYTDYKSSDEVVNLHVDDNWNQDRKYDHTSHYTPLVVEPTLYHRHNSVENDVVNLNSEVVQDLLQYVNLKPLAPHQSLEVRPQKLVIHREGGYYDAHYNTVRGEGHIGTLIVPLNSEYLGGEIEITYDRHIEVVKSTQSYVVVHDDCELRINPVTVGARVVMVYDIYGHTTHANNPQEHAQYNKFWRSEHVLTNANYTARLHPPSTTTDDDVLTALEEELTHVDSVTIALPHVYPEYTTTPALLQKDDRALYDLLSKQYDVEVVSTTVVRNKCNQCPENSDCFHVDRTVAKPFSADIVKATLAGENRYEQLNSKVVLPFPPTKEHILHYSENARVVSGVYITTGLQVKKKLL